MRLFGSFNRPDIHQGLQEFRTTLGALLLDVRTPEEFREGRIPGSRNLPLQNLDKSHTIIENEHVPVYLYCHSGARSARVCFFRASFVGAFLFFTAQFSSRR